MLVREGVRIDEDRLTHAVFGLLRYLPPSLWFHPFIDELRRRNPAVSRVLDISSTPKVKLWPSYSVPHEWQRKFWRPQPRNVNPQAPKGSICPDALITTDEWIMLVESEYSHDVDAEQLFQQFALASCEEKTNGCEFFLLLVNAALTRPARCKIASADRCKPEASVSPEDSVEKYIAECCAHALGLSFGIEDVIHHLLWINWQTLCALLSGLHFEDDADFRGLPEPYQAMVHTMREDVCELLVREHLVPIDFDIVKKLAGLEVTPEAVPFIAVISPVLPFLTELTLCPETIPQRQGLPDILKALKILRPQPEFLPKPLLVGDSQVPPAKPVA